MNSMLEKIAGARLAKVNSLLTQLACCTVYPKQTTTNARLKDRNVYFHRIMLGIQLAFGIALHFEKWVSLQVAALAVG